MRTTAKRIRFAGTLLPAFLLFGCDTPTGIPPEIPELPEQAEQLGAPGPSVDADGCFEFEGERFCTSTERSGELREAL